MAEHEQHESATPSEAYDTDGRPETPTDVALEKRKKRNVAYAGLAVGGLGLAFVMFARHNNASAAPAAIPGTTGVLAGSGDTTAGVDSLGQAVNSLNTQQSQLLASLTADEQRMKQQTNAQFTVNQQLRKANLGFQSQIARLTQELHATSGTSRSDQGFGAQLPQLDWRTFAQSVKPGSGTLTPLGKSGTPGLESVKGGAPVYALLGGQWVQGFDPRKLAVGTPEATATSARAYIVPARK